MLWFCNFSFGIVFVILSQEKSFSVYRDILSFRHWFSCPPTVQNYFIKLNVSLCYLKIFPYIGTYYFQATIFWLWLLLFYVFLLVSFDYFHCFLFLTYNIKWHNMSMTRDLWLIPDLGVNNLKFLNKVPCVRIAIVTSNFNSTVLNLVRDLHYIRILSFMKCTGKY